MNAWLTVAGIVGILVVLAYPAYLGAVALHKYLIERGVVSWFRENEVVMDNLITVFETWQLIMGMGQVSLCSDVFYDSNRKVFEVNVC